ncbi:MAG: hypothetical protein ACTS10_10935 [Kiloniellales bacterium]
MSLKARRRLRWAAKHLRPIHSDLVIVWEDPADPDAPAKVTGPPDARWLAAALFGGILPPVEAARAGLDAEAIGPLSLDGAIEYLLQLCLPSSVWAAPEGNRPRFLICRQCQLPANREYRNSWEIAA